MARLGMAVVLWLAVMAGAAHAAPVPLDGAGDALPPIEAGPVAQAVFRAAQFVLPILGVIEILRVLVNVLLAVNAGLSGKEAVQERLLRLGLAVLLVAIPLSGAWVPFANGILKVTSTMLDPLERAVERLP